MVQHPRIQGVFFDGGDECHIGDEKQGLDEGGIFL
jgi:hypothetical protein